MPEQKRHTVVTWEGDLDAGQGMIIDSSSGMLKDALFTRASRVEQSNGRMSPEELLAGAHAQCYIMGLAHILTNAGTPPEHLTVTAECSLELTRKGPSITKMTLRISGRVPDLDAVTFEHVARKADELCPISRVLRNNLVFCLETHLEVLGN